MSKFFTTHSEIEFIKDSHQYIHKVDKDQYTSVTRLLSSVKVPFDRDRIAGLMARKEAADNGISLNEAKANILESWDERKDSSVDWGNLIHGNIDSYVKTGKYDPECERAVVQLSNFLKGYYRYYSEVKLYSYKYKVAGTGDLVIQRQSSRSSVYDFYDNKTFLHCGVELDSIKIKEGMMKHYNRFFLSPFEHLEQCNYNSTALQLSVYALMAELQFGIKVGKLAMMYYDNDLNLYLYPIPYMRTDAMILLELNLNRKQLPK